MYSISELAFTLALYTGRMYLTGKWPECSSADINRSLSMISSLTGMNVDVFEYPCCPLLSYYSIRSQPEESETGFV